MTPLAARLQERRIHAFSVRVGHAPSDEPLPGGQRSLAHLRPHESARVVGYSPELPASHARRLFDLGFAPGADVYAVRRAPLLDPSIYRVADGQVALRRSLARHVLVDLS